MGMQKNKERQRQRAFKQLQEKKRPQLLQTVHQQFDKRMHDLDYLQWMQKNTRRYTVGIGVLAVLLSMSVVWGMEGSPKILKEQENASTHLAMESDAAVVQGLSSQPAKEQQSADRRVEEAPPQPDIEKKQAVQRTPENSVCFNPLHLAGYQAPCSGMLVYNYGLGYDPLYEDYRYHKELCYKNGDGTVFSCIDGVIAEVELEQQWQVAIQTEKALVQYAGIDSCSVSVGDRVRAGDRIGTAEGNVYIRAVKKE